MVSKNQKQHQDFDRKLMRQPLNCYVIASKTKNVFLLNRIIFWRIL